MSSWESSACSLCYHKSSLSFISLDFSKGQTMSSTFVQETETNPDKSITNFIQTEGLSEFVRICYIFVIVSYNQQQISLTMVPVKLLILMNKHLLYHLHKTNLSQFVNIGFLFKLLGARGKFIGLYILTFQSLNVSTYNYIYYSVDFAANCHIYNKDYYRLRFLAIHPMYYFQSPKSGTNI